MTDKYANPFLLDHDKYVRNINVLRNYVDQSATYLSISTGQTYERCKRFVVDKIRVGGDMQIIDPQLTIYKRKENGDREEEVIALSEYLKEIITDGLVVAPTGTTYIPYKRSPSIYTPFIRVNKKRRSIAKKAELAAQMAGDTITEQFENSKQTSRKRSNNSLSGAQVSAGTVLSNKTAHSSLTSTCRTTSGYGNANNEKLLAGNRHYRNPDITLNNLVSIVANTNYSKLDSVINKYSLYIPTVEDCIECVFRSASMYWSSRRKKKQIDQFIQRLTPIQRAAIVYTGDFFHLAKHNGELIRGMITELIEKKTSRPEDVIGIYKKYPESYKHWAAQICEEECRGKKPDEIKNTIIDQLIAGTTENIALTLDKYRDLIGAIFATINVPGSVAYFPDSVRETALVSDTDSTIFTVQDWVSWYFNTEEPNCGSKENAVAATMISIASEAITHILAMMSANIGVDESMLYDIAMKNEFKFDVFVVTNLAKHYYALIGCREGNLFKDYKNETKGVHLKTSNVPESVRKVAKELMDYILYSTLKNEKVSILKILKDVADCERDVMQQIKLGSPMYFKQAQIKNHDAYKAGIQSPYMHYLLWEEVFAPKYGHAAQPPYAVIKINTEIQSSTDMKEWLDKLADQELKARMIAWMEKYNKKVIPTIQLPKTIVEQNGIPDEILHSIGIRKMVKDITTVLSIILESIGYYYTNDKITRLVSDEH